LSLYKNNKEYNPEEKKGPTQFFHY
jgi:hypothetical protein